MLVGFASSWGGCFHYRCELPARVLPLHGAFEVVTGMELLVNPPPQPAPIGIDVAGAEVIPQVIVLAGGHPATLGGAVIEAARASGQRVVCDCDDYPALPRDNPHWRPEAEHSKLEALRAADAVTVSTPFLRDVLERQGIRSTLIRNSIDPDRYRYERTENERNRIEELGDEWTPGRSSSRELVVGYRGLLCGFHDDDVRELVGLADLEHARFVHVGADPRELAGVHFADLARIPAERVEGRAAVVFEGYGPALAGIDVGIIPLAPRPFSRAKSNIAALEWHAAGVPWLATGHGEFALAGDGLGLVHQRREWVELLAGLRAPHARETLYRAQGRPAVLPGGARWAEVLMAAMGVAP